jgi:NAD(P)-dependent dehydrogenase (short-subunit alcohol dehydrogenase family)
MDMNGRICMITGATNGIGKSTAMGLAQKGATVVIVGRNAEKTKLLIDEIQRVTGNENIDGFVADLSSQQEVRRLAQQFKEKYQQLHVLVNNAGAVFMKRELSVDGIEMTFALNHLAYFLLTHLLLDMIIASSPARIINVSSDAHLTNRIEFDNLQGERNYTGFGAYSTSKLANVLFTNELAQRLKMNSASANVTANALHPGFINSGFGKNNSGFTAKLMAGFITMFGGSVDEGAKTPIFLASDPSVVHISGQYFSNCKPSRVAPIAKDPEIAKRLWDLSLNFVNM